MRSGRQARAWLGIVVTALVIVTGCSSGGASSSGSGSGSGSGSSSAGGASSGVPTADHVMVVVFENEDAKDIVGDPDAPYLTSLAKAGANFTDAHGETHPSQPNYLALFSGSTQGLTDDSCPHTFSGPNLGGQLLAAGHSFVGYAEGLPKAGYTGCSTGDYARKHSPWVDFPGLSAAQNQPYSALPKKFSNLPTVSFVVPNLCHDMHDCGVAAGDRWARDHLSGYVDWAMKNNSLLIVTFDEDGGSEGNHIATMLVGPMVQPGTSDQRIDHYSLLRTVEDMYGLRPLGQAAQASPITGVWADSAG